MIEFLCLQCCDCGTFQCQQKRKDKKFSCKVCGKKQSVVRVYAISYKAKDIRGLVMKYNEMRGKGELADLERELQPVDDSELGVTWEGEDAEAEVRGAPSEESGVSKWAQFMDDDTKKEDDKKDDDDDDEDDVVQAFMMKRQRLQEKRERRRQVAPYQKRSRTEREEHQRWQQEPTTMNLSRFKEYAKAVIPVSGNESCHEERDEEEEEEEEEKGTKKIVVDPNSKWAAFL